MSKQILKQNTIYLSIVLGKSSNFEEFRNFEKAGQILLTHIDLPLIDEVQQLLHVHDAHVVWQHNDRVLARVVLERDSTVSSTMTGCWHGLFWRETAQLAAQ